MFVVVVVAVVVAVGGGCGGGDGIVVIFLVVVIDVIVVIAVVIVVDDDEFMLQRCDTEVTGLEPSHVSFSFSGNILPQYVANGRKRNVANARNQILGAQIANSKCRKINLALFLAIVMEKMNQIIPSSQQLAFLTISTIPNHTKHVSMS